MYRCRCRYPLNLGSATKIQTQCDLGFFRCHVRSSITIRCAMLNHGFVLFYSVSRFVGSLHRPPTAPDPTPPPMPPTASPAPPPPPPALVPPSPQPSSTFTPNSPFPFRFPYPLPIPLPLPLPLQPPPLPLPQALSPLVDEIRIIHRRSEFLRLNYQGLRYIATTLSGIDLR